MRRELAQLVTCASLVAAAIALTPAGPAAQQQSIPTAEAMERAQEAYKADRTREAIARDKQAVVQQLMERWRDEIGETQRAREGFEGAFMRADPEKLLKLTQARTWDAVVATQLGMNPEATLNSGVNDLVFTPITPCRVMDSRFGAGAWAGPFTSGQTISLYVTDPLNGGSPAHTQGGASNCGIPFAAGNAVALNITVVPITGSGDLKIFPFGATSPNASIINFYAGLNLANATSAGIAPANPTNDLSITVEFAASVHIIVDVMGYYAETNATALENMRVQSTPLAIPNGSGFNAVTPACPSGFTLTGGGFNESLLANPLSINQNGPGNNPPTFWQVRGTNSTGGAASLTVYGVCSRVPGR